MKRNISIGDKLTLFSISDYTACCFRHEVIVKDIREAGNLVLCERGKRKLFVRDVSIDSMLVLEGHDLNLKADTETGSFWGNACFNLVGESREAILDILEKRSLKEISLKQRETMLFKTFVTSDSEDANELLYPETQTV